MTLDNSSCESDSYLQHTATKDVSKDVPRESTEKEALRKSLSVASCSISVVGAPEEQVHLLSSVPLYQRSHRHDDHKFHGIC